MNSDFSNQLKKGNFAIASKIKGRNHPKILKKKIAIMICPSKLPHGPADKILTFIELPDGHSKLIQSAASDLAKGWFCGFFLAIRRKDVMRRQAKSRFTLTELLCIIAIIIILVTTLLPTLKRAIIIANGITCKNQMRNIGLSIGIYTNDWNGCFWGGNSQPPHQLPNTNVLTCWAVRLYNSGYFPYYIGRAHPMGAPPPYNCHPNWICPEYARINGTKSLSEHGFYEATQVLLQWNGNGTYDYREDRPANWFNITNPLRRCILMETKWPRHYLTGGVWNEFQLFKLYWPNGPDWTGDLAVDPFATGGTFHFGRPNFVYADFHVDTLNRAEFWQNYTLAKGGGPLFFPWDF